MRTFFVVLAYPIIGQLTYLIQTFEHIHVQHLIAIGTIEPFNKRILRGLSRLNKFQMNAVRLCR